MSAERTNTQGKIEVVPFIPQKGYRNEALNMDFYEPRMANAAFLLGMKDVQVVFDCFFRKNPNDSGYSISAGQEQLTDFLMNYHFDEIACQWLLHKGMHPDFVEYLSTYKWKGTMYALPEGTVAYPNTAIVRIKCDIIGALLIETHLLQTMNFNSLITTQSTKIVRAAEDGGVMEFGTRRAQGMSAGLFGARAAVLGGCTGTANCLAEINFGEPVEAVGTMAHAWIELFETELEAFIAFAKIYPDSTSLLVDTYNTKNGIINAIKTDNYLIEQYPDDPNKRVKSIRIDSGDLAYATKMARKMLDEAGKSYIKIVASNGLKEKTIRSLNAEQHAPINSFGVGENLITSAECPVFGGVYKLVAVQKLDGSWTPRMKCSDTLEKAIIPGYKMLYRVYDEEGRGYLDLITMEDEEIEIGKPIKVYTTDWSDSRKEYTITPNVIKPLLVPYIVDGELVREMPSVQEIRDYIKDQLENKVWPEELRSQYPHKHYVDMTESVYKLRKEMYESLHG